MQQKNTKGKYPTLSSSTSCFFPFFSMLLYKRVFHHFLKKKKEKRRLWMFRCRYLDALCGMKARQIPLNEIVTAGRCFLFLILDLSRKVFMVNFNILQCVRMEFVFNMKKIERTVTCVSIIFPWQVMLLL